MIEKLNKLLCNKIRMSNLMGCLLICIMLLASDIYGVNISTTSGHSTQKAGLVYDENVYDFGNISFDEAKECTNYFVLYNVSDSPIKIRGCHTTCGCIKAEAIKNTIYPGEHATVKVNVNWASSSRSGEQEGTIIVETDNTETPVVRLIVKGFVINHAILSTNVLKFGEIKPGNKKTLTVKLSQGTYTKPFHILDIDKPNEYFSIERLGTSGKKCSDIPLIGEPCIFAVTFTAPEARGQYDDSIVLHTDIEGQPDLKINLEAKSVGSFDIQPDALFFSSPIYMDNIQEIRIDSKSLGITSVCIITPNQDAVNPFYIKQISMDTSNNLSSFLLLVGFKPFDMSLPVCQATLQISFGKEVLNIPITAVVQNSSDR